MSEELHKIITPHQIRAARALLDWTQSDLAKKSGLSLRALNSIERGLSVPRIDNLRAICGALEKGDIEFTELDGVRRRTEQLDVLKFEGPDCYQQFTLDTIKEVREAGGQVMANIVSEKNFLDVADDIIDDYYRSAARHKIKERILLPRGDTNILSMPASYRWIHPDVLGQVTYFIYGDNIAFLMKTKLQRMVIIRNPAMADMFRRQFETKWAMAEEPWFAKRYKSLDVSVPWSVAKAAEARAWIEKNKPAKS